MPKISRRMILFLLCVAGMALLPVQALADDAIDTDADVRLTISYAHDHAPISGAQFDLYYVASVDANANFTLVGDFRVYPVQVNGLNAEELKMLAETLSSYVDRDELTPLDSGSTNSQGDLFFPSSRSALKPGLYLVMGRALAKDGYTYRAEPFLVSLPKLNADTGAWDYKLIAEPKHTREENPPTPPDDSTVERRVLKIWKQDAESLRPQEVAIQLLKDGAIYDTVTLNAGNSWRYVWEKLPEYNEDGTKIVWRVTEDAVADDYKVLISQEGVTFTVVNTYAPGNTTRAVSKIWNDTDNESKRPQSVQVTLLKNGVVYDTQTLNAANGWKYTWNALPQYDENDQEITWTLHEASVSGYSSSVRQEGNVFLLTNTFKKQKLPQTGLLWWPVPLLTAAGLAFLIVGAQCRKKRS